MVTKKTIRTIRDVLQSWQTSMRKIFFKPYVIKTSIEGVDFDFLIADSDGQEWYDFGASDSIWWEIAFWRDVLTAPGDVIIECGGHHGATALVLAEFVGEKGKVITVEAMANNFSIIQKNIALNNRRNIVPKLAAVGDVRGEIRIKNQSNASVSLSGVGSLVEVVRLDDLIDHAPTAIKIDVEGFELRVLRGASRILETRPKIAVEVHPEALLEFGDTVEELIEAVRLPRYDYWVQRSDDDPPQPCSLSTLSFHARFHLYAAPREKSRAKNV